MTNSNLSGPSHSALTVALPVLFVDAGHLTPPWHGDRLAPVRISPVDWTLTSAFTLAMLRGNLPGAPSNAAPPVFGTIPGSDSARHIRAEPAVAVRADPVWTDDAGNCSRFKQQPSSPSPAHVNTQDRRAQTHRWRLWRGCSWPAASSLEALLSPCLLLALTSGFFIEGSWLRATRYALRRWWRPLADVPARLAGGYATLYGAQLGHAPALPQGGLVSFSGVLCFARTELGDALRTQRHSGRPMDGGSGRGSLRRLTVRSALARRIPG